MPVKRDKLKKAVRGGAIIGAASLMALAGILSSPVAFEAFRLFKVSEAFVNGHGENTKLKMVVLV